MQALVIALLGAMLLSWQLATTQPKEVAFRNVVAGDVAAANFWSYRSSVSKYRNANPGATGTVADGSLTWEGGYIRNPAWTNYIQGGTLYTYSNAALKTSTIEAIANRGGRTLMIGVASGGTMTSLTGGATGFVLPVSVPNGSVVVIGN